MATLARVALNTNITKDPDLTNRVLIGRNVNFQEYERRKIKKARDIQKLSKSESESEVDVRIYRDEDRFEAQDDSNPVLSTLAPSLVEKGKHAFSKRRVSTNE